MPRLVALALLPLLATSAVAGSTDEVMRLVPATSSVCLLVQDLRGNAARLAESPFAAWFATSRMGHSLLASEELKQLAAIERVLGDQLGVGFADIRDDVFGDAVAFAYQPPSRDDSGGEAGVVIGKAGKVATLTRIAAKLNAAQMKSGELKEVKQKTHAGVGYVERVKADGRGEYYFIRDDGTFAYSVEEALVKAVIDRLASAEKAGPTSFATAIESLGVTDAVAVLVFDPKTLAADMAAGEKESADPNEQAFLRQFARLWGSVKAVGVSLTLDSRASLALTMVAPVEQVPAELRPLFVPSAKASELWSAIPEDALFAAAGRFEWAKFATMAESFLSDEARRGLKQLNDEVISPAVGKDLLPRVKAAVGPDWGVWVTAPTKGDAGPLPAVTFALRVRPDGGDGDTVGQGIVSALDFVAQYLRVEYNRSNDDQFAVVEERLPDGTLKSLKNDTALPPGVRPTYGLLGNYLVLGSGTEAARRFVPPTRAAEITEAPLVRLNAGKLAEYLTTRGEELGGTLAALKGEKPDQVRDELKGYAAFLELFDRIEFHHTGDGKRMRLAVRVEMKKPLKK